ncbi:hypothetical protein RHSIM_Rhsim04G0095200 [Rhododendron simsii]|uniref:Uncharacterized protein n=1 Tax=Rhododendron simsii TaxID=118357 RepID=A0A834H0P8_RHOSS|nr:hypothetical protein RHSIM_Rhsim04G0095200 [Rhododendron simsii]
MPRRHHLDLRPRQFDSVQNNQRTIREIEHCRRPAEAEGSGVVGSGGLLRCPLVEHHLPHSPGVDIDECENPNLNNCDGNATCTNTPGSFNCSCNPHYIGDGRSDGRGCIPDQTSQISVIKLSLAVTFSSLGALLLLICMWWLYREVNRRKEAKLKEKFFKRNGGLLLQQQLSSDQGNLETTKLFTSKELKKATDNYNANRILGQGGQGTVYKGMLTDGRIVAIKKSKALDEGKHEQFINEVVILSRINIRNVVKLFGCCLETEVPMLVYEFIPNGTLFQCLHEQNEEFPLTWDLRLRIATEIAGALFYLHSLASIAIYHRDIKSANILLDEKFRAKVSDFGISRSISVDNTHLTTAVQGTLGYLDPEYFQSSQFTEKSDVYSFGVVLVELLTGKKPILSGKSNEGGSLTAYFLLTMKENRLYDILDARVVKEGGEKEILAVANIAKRCLYLDGSSRPTMKEVVMELDGIRMSNGATATVKQSWDDVEYATEDDLTGPQEAASTSTGSSYCAMNIELPLLLDKSSSSLHAHILLEREREREICDNDIFAARDMEYVPAVLGYGICSCNAEVPLLVYEFIPNGTLSSISMTKLKSSLLLGICDYGSLQKLQELYLTFTQHLP